MQARSRLGQTFKRLGVLALLLALGTSQAGAIGAPTPAWPVQPISATEFVLATAPVDRGHPFLDSSLSQLIREYETAGPAAAAAFAAQHGLVLEGNRVQVVLEGTGTEAVAAVSAAIEQAGGAVQQSHMNLVQAMVPIRALVPLVERADVQFIREPRRFIPAVGAQTSEGVAASLANIWHAHASGRTGTGVKVAILDSGFASYTSLLGTDLPATVTTQDFGTGWPGTSNHGTACAEVAYDMAPGATMYLVKAGTTVEFGNAVNWLIGQGVDVVSFSGGWLLGGPGDGTGTVDTAVNNARTNGIVFTVASGNEAQVSWSGTYVDSGGTHLWPHGSNVNCFGSGTNFSCYNIPAGTVIQVGLHWDDWTAVNQDYDLFLVRWTGSAWSAVAASQNDQNGGAGQTPEEYISYTAGYSTAYGVVVAKYSATRAVCFRLRASQNMTHLDEWVASRSLSYPADASGAVTAGAVDVSTYALEPYSNQGPTFGAGGACTGGSTKPDLAGYDNVSTVTYGPRALNRAAAASYVAGVESFSGTSPAAPHVAGAAALYIQAYKATTGGGTTKPTPAQTQAYLESKATDLGSAGKDNLYGAGRLTLGALGPNAVKLTALRVTSALPSALPLAALGLAAVAVATAAWQLVRRHRSR